MKKFLFVVIALLVTSNSLAVDRCQSFITSVRSESIKQFGVTYPWWYNIGQLKQESCCRATATAFDGGMGLAQFMPKTSSYIQSLMGEKLDPYNPTHAIRMQTFYLKRIHTKESIGPGLWDDYQIYNGGRGNLLKEKNRAGVFDWDKMKASCQRKKIKMKWGILDFCEVNYEYSKNIYKYGSPYRRGPDSMRYW